VSATSSAPAAGAPATSDFAAVSRHAGTVFIGQLAVMAFGVTDTIVAGRYSDAALAALSVGTAVYVSVFVALMGVIQALLPVWAELHGAGERAEIGRSVRQALYLAGLCTAVGLLVLMAPGPLLQWTKVPEGLQAEVRSYLAILALSLPAALLFRLYSTLNQSLGNPRFVTWVQAIGLLVKIPLSIWFTFGGLGLPAGGAAGCAWATLVVQCTMLLVAVWALRSQAFYAPYAIWQRLERPDWRHIADFARLGVPGGLAVMVEVTSFTLMALFIARMGAVASAGHQIAANIAAVLYMSPLSIGIATSARVGYWLGAGQAERARAAMRTGLTLAASIALCLVAVLLILRSQIATLYAGNPAVAALAATLLGWVALYHLADAVQATCVFVLRCYRVVVMPLVVYCLLQWGLGLTGGQMLAYRGLGDWPALASPSAFWTTSAIALWITALLFLALLWRTAYRAR